MMRLFTGERTESARSGHGRRRGKPTKIDRSRTHRDGCVGLWTTGSGFASLPPSHSLIFPYSATCCQAHAFSLRIDPVLPSLFVEESLDLVGTDIEMRECVYVAWSATLR